MNDPFVAHQLMSVGTGHQHCKDVVSSSRFLLTSGRDDPGIRFLGDISLTGGHENRDMRRKLERVLGDQLPASYDLKLSKKLSSRHTGTQTIQTTPIFDSLSVLHKSPAQWQVSLFGNYDPQVVGVWWEKMRTTSWVESNVFRDEELWQQRHNILPIFWHSDGGAVYNGKSYHIVHWSTPFTYDIDPYDAKMYVMMCEEDSMVPELTDEEILIYKVHWVLSGVHLDLLTVG